MTSKIKILQQKLISCNQKTITLECTNTTLAPCSSSPSSSDSPDDDSVTEPHISSLRTPEQNQVILIRQTHQCRTLELIRNTDPIIEKAVTLFPSQILTKETFLHSQTRTLIYLPKVYVRKLKSPSLEDPWYEILALHYLRVSSIKILLCYPNPG